MVGRVEDMKGATHIPDEMSLVTAIGVTIMARSGARVELAMHQSL